MRYLYEISNLLDNLFSLITEYLFISRPPCDAGHDRVRSAKTKVIIGRVSVLTVSWEDPGPLPGTQMGFVSHAEHETWLFRPRQQGKHHKNPCLRSPWRPNGQFGPPVMQSLAQAATLGHKDRLKATWQHRNQTEITRLSPRWPPFSRVTGSGCYRANSRCQNVLVNSLVPTEEQHKSPAPRHTATRPRPTQSNTGVLRVSGPASIFHQIVWKQGWQLDGGSPDQETGSQIPASGLMGSLGDAVISSGSHCVTQTGWKLLDCTEIQQK